MAFSVICIAPTQEHADQIVVELKTAGFQTDDISILFPDKTGAHSFAHQVNTKAPEGAVAGASAGGLVGGALGVLAGIGLLVVPGVGPFIAAGPILAALSGMAVGAAVGGIGGALIGIGIPEIEAKRFESMVRGGNILLSVHTVHPADINVVKEIFRRSGAQHIAHGEESKAPAAI